MSRRSPAPSWPTPDGLRLNNTIASPLGSVVAAGSVRNSALGSGYQRIYGYYALVYVLDGDAYYTDVRGVPRDIGPGDLILVFPDLAHTYGPKGSGVWTSLWISFQGKVFDLWRQAGLLDDRKPVHHLEPVDAWCRRFDSVLGALRQPGYSPPLLEICRLQTLLAEVLGGAGQQTAYQDDLRWASRACAMLDAALATEWKNTARHLGMTAETFRKRFTRLVGHPPARYRMRRLIDRACELIQEHRLTDKQIAEALGFCDEYYFSRRFKQITGHSPRAFRRLLAVTGAAYREGSHGMKGLAQ